MPIVKASDHNTFRIGSKLNRFREYLIKNLKTILAILTHTLFYFYYLCSDFQLSFKYPFLKLSPVEKPQSQIPEENPLPGQDLYEYGAHSGNIQELPFIRSAFKENRKGMKNIHQKIKINNKVWIKYITF